MTQLPEGTAWLSALFDESPVAVGFARDGIVVDANSAYVKLFGYDAADELRGKSLVEHIAPEEKARVSEHIARRARGEALPEKYETRGLRKDGTEFPFIVTMARVAVADGPLMFAFITDVTELHESEERFRTLSSSAFEGVMIHADGKVLLVNEAGAALCGYGSPDEMVGTSMLDLVAPESREHVAESIRRGVTGPYEAVGLRKDGTKIIVEARGRSVVHRGAPARVVVIRDITERKRAEAAQNALAERMRHAQKLESLGVLAGGVAHDFNNILTVITNSVALAKTGQDTTTHLDSIALAADRAAELCQQMLAYAGKATFAREAVDLSRLVTEMLSMLELSLRKKATLVRELAPELPMVLGDATQIRQVVLNLVINAAEAISRADGEVVVTTGFGTYDAGAFAGSAAGGDPKPGPYVHVEVRDDGVGMDESTVAQMFDPFFSTKFVGRGLGMATVLGIVRGHGGAIEVESAPGRGTRVRVFFPTTPNPRPMAAREGDEVVRGRGTVLVVDDERGVRATTKLLLEQFGFDALVAADGLEALEILKARATRVDAILLDRTMPRLDGIQTMSAIREIAPEIPIVLSSGAGQVDSSAKPDAVLAKPYSTSELLAVLRHVLAR